MSASAVTPAEVHDTLRAHVLVDGYDLVLDTAASRGSWLVDALDGTRYLDVFTFYASSPLGMNHPALADDEEFRAQLLEVALNKPANSDVYTTHYAEFVRTLHRVMGEDQLPWSFFIEGGALAVENALKAAFDWKSRSNEAAGRPASLGTKVLHLTGAFHGRSGYTLAITNTDPVKVDRFPRFPWPRIDAPHVRHPIADHRESIEAQERHALRQAEDAFLAHPHDIACTIVEPIQSEGGDNHLRPEFLQELQRLTHEHDALFVVDEVQTGAGITGTPWVHTQLGLEPDLLAFGKKLQVCGVMAGRRVAEVDDNVFTVSSRINSTWGGNLTDMVRARRILEVIEADGLIERAGVMGKRLLDLLTGLASDHPTLIGNVRGRGLLCAVDLPDPALRDQVKTRLREEEKVLMLGCGTQTLRFRPSLAVTEDELELAVGALGRVLTRVAA